MNGVGRAAQRARKAGLDACRRKQVDRIIFFRSVNRDMKNEMIDRATAEVKAA